MKQVTIIDYGSGNLHSIAKAFEHEAGGVVVKVSSDAAEIARASHVVLPGVGAFADCLRGLKEAKGVMAALEKAVMVDKKPFLGVCVGMQMLAEEGFENGRHKGLGWIEGSVVGIDSQNDTIKVPHMGWNELVITARHSIFDGIKTGDHAYFVHSYWMDCKNVGDILAKVDYGAPLTAAIANDNIVATQFHPEKSQQVGLKLINNFLKM
jgi:imidazole glycerol-phosphate synthase subunit HisH